MHALYKRLAGECISLEMRLQEHLRSSIIATVYPRLPTLAFPKSDYYDMMVLQPDMFQIESGFSVEKFNELLDAVRYVLESCRDIGDEYGPMLNSMRRQRRYKYLPCERLFFFFAY